MFDLLFFLFNLDLDESAELTLMSEIIVSVNIKICGRFWIVEEKYRRKTDHYGMVIQGMGIF